MAAFGTAVVILATLVTALKADTGDRTTEGVGIIFDHGVMVYVDLSSSTNSSITTPSTLWFSDNAFPNVTALTGDYRNRGFYVVRQHQQRGSILVVTIPADINLEWPSQDIYFNQYTPTINGLTFDWLSSTLYWTDASKRLIGAVPTRHLPYLDVIWTTVNREPINGVPTGIVVNAQRRYLFWSEYGDLSNGVRSKISRSDLTGSSRIDLYTTRVGRITALSLDLSRGRLFWLSSDESLVGSCDFNGQNVTTSSKSDFASIVSMTVYQDLLLLGSEYLYVYNASGGSNLNRIIYYPFVYPLSLVNASLISMATLNERSQPNGTSPCQTNSGDCSQFCFTTSPTTRQCGCGNSYTLNDDGLSCTAVPLATNNYLLIADVVLGRLFQLDPATNQTVLLQDIVDPINPLTLAYDPHQQYIFASTNVFQFPSIVRMNLNGTNSTVIWTANNARSVVGQMKYDNVSQHLYFIDATFSTINQLATSFSVSNATFAVVVRGQSVRAITVDPTSGLLYWSECPTGQNIATIKCARAVDGSQQRTVFSANVTMTCYTSLNIDISKQVLYWTATAYDVSSNPVAATIEMASTNGTDWSLLYSDTRKVFSRSTLLEDSLYIVETSSESSILWRFNLTTKWMQQLNTWFPGLSDVISSSSEPFSSSSMSSATSAVPTQTSKTPLIIGLVVGLGGGLVVLVVVVALLTVRATRVKKRTAVEKFRSPATLPPDPYTREEVYDELEEGTTGTFRPNNNYLALIFESGSSIDAGYLRPDPSVNGEKRRVSGLSSIPDEYLTCSTESTADQNSAVDVHSNNERTSTSMSAMTLTTSAVNIVRDSGSTALDSGITSEIRLNGNDVVTTVDAAATAHGESVEYSGIPVDTRGNFQSYVNTGVGLYVNG